MKRWISTLLLFGLLSFIAPAVHAQQSESREPAAGPAMVPVTPDLLRSTKRPALGGAESKRRSDLICSLSAFFSADGDQTIRPETRFDGRGLVTCKNDFGFTTEFPVLAYVDAELAPALRKIGEIAFSGNTAPFVVPREASQLQDAYDVRLPPRVGAQPALLFRGKRHDLVIEMKLNSQTTDISGIKVSALKLTFDEAAPDLE